MMPISLYCELRASFVPFDVLLSEKYLANLFCDTLASINLIYVSFVIIYNQETGRKNEVPDTEPFQ